MFKIDREQLTALEDGGQLRFRERLQAHLLHCWPRQMQSLPTSRWPDLIDHGLVRSACHGVERERDIVRYFDCMALLGADFDTRDDTRWAAEILASVDLTVSAKVARIWQHGKTFVFDGNTV